MPLYEHTFLARQDVTQAQVEALMKEFSDLIEEGQGKVTGKESAKEQTAAESANVNVTLESFDAAAGDAAQDELCKEPAKQLEFA